LFLFLKSTPLNLAKEAANHHYLFATQRLTNLLRRGFLATDSAYGKVRFAIARHALRFYFPALWPEAEQDEEWLRAEGVG
jgi:hypothetical protein